MGRRLHRLAREAPSSTPTASPRLRRSYSAWPPHQLEDTGVGVGPDGRTRVRAPQPGPYPPDLSRYYAYGASATGSLSLYLLASLAGPGPSGDPRPSRRCRGCFPPSPAFPGSDCPQLLPGRCDGPAAKVSHLHSMVWRLVAHLAFLEVLRLRAAADADLRGGVEVSLEPQR